MINIEHLLKVSAAWVSIVYTICFVGVASLPGIRPGFMMYGLHMRGFDVGQNVLNFWTFISGLIIWNVLTLLAVWLFAYLFNKIKQ